MKPETQATWNKFNQLDIDLKKKRDEQTGALTFIDDLNLTIEELGQRGFSYKTVNTLVGQQIAQTARIKGDRRRLDLLDQIKTPGGVYGHTVAGQKLKWSTVRQIEQDSEASEREARAIYNHDQKKLLVKHKILLGELIQKKAGETNPEKIQEIEKEIQEAIVFAGIEGVGGQVQIYVNRLVTGLSSSIQGKNRILGLEGVIDPESGNNQTVREYLLEILEDPATDSTEHSRATRLATAFEGLFITLDDDGKNLVKQMEKDYVAPTTTPLYKAEAKKLQSIEDNHLVRFGVDRSIMGRALRRGEQPVPVEILDLIMRYKRKLRGTFTTEFGSYSNTLEGRDEAPRYGFGSWTEPEKDAFLDSNKYKEKVSQIALDFDKDMKKAVDKHLSSTIKKRDNHKEIIKLLKPAPEVGPDEFSDLQRMLYNDSDSTFYDPIDTAERFKKAIYGLSLKGTDTQKGIADLHWVSPDMDKWFNEAISGSKDPKTKQKQIQALWNWGTYLITRRQIKLIEVDSTLSKEKKEEKIAWYRKNKPPFPKDITFFIGAKQKIKEQEKKKEKKQQKKTSKLKQETVKQKESVTPEEKPIYKDGVVDLKALWDSLW